MEGWVEYKTWFILNLHCSIWPATGAKCDTTGAYSVNINAWKNSCVICEMCYLQRYELTGHNHPIQSSQQCMTLPMINVPGCVFILYILYILFCIFWIILAVYLYVFPVIQTFHWFQISVDWHSLVSIAQCIKNKGHFQLWFRTCPSSARLRGQALPHFAAVTLVGLA